MDRGTTQWCSAFLLNATLRFCKAVISILFNALRYKVVFLSADVTKSEFSEVLPFLKIRDEHTYAKKTKNSNPDPRHRR